METSKKPELISAYFTKKGKLIRVHRMPEDQEFEYRILVTSLNGRKGYRRLVAQDEESLTYWIHKMMETE